MKTREIGYVLNPEYRASGYIPEAVNRVIDYGFREMNLDLIWCGHFEDNYKSKRVNEKCGFVYIFKKKRILPVLENKTVIQWYYNIYKDDYFNNEKIVWMANS